jgi:hypothetical protein
MSIVSKVSPSIAGSPEQQRKVAESLNQVIDKAQPFGVVSVTASVTVTETYADYLCDATAGTITATLPEAAAHKGRRYNVSKIDASANPVIVDGFGSETIVGSITASLVAQWECFTLLSSGTAWVIV